MKRPLGSAAIPAGIFLLLTAALSAAMPYVLPIPFLRFYPQMISDALLVVTAILMLTRRRNAAYAVLFAIAGVVVIGLVRAWYYYNINLPFFLCCGARAFGCLGMAFVCMRRAEEPKRGPWVLLVVPQVLLVGLLTVAAFLAAPPYGDEYLTEDTFRMVFAVTAVDEGLMLLAMIFTCVAFSRAPAPAEKTEMPTWSDLPPEREKIPAEPVYDPHPQQQASASAQQQSQAPAPPQTASRPKQNAASVQEAVIEILDD